MGDDDGDGEKGNVPRWEKRSAEEMLRLDASKTRFEEVSRSRHEESRSGPSESQDHEKQKL